MTTVVRSCACGTLHRGRGAQKLCEALTAARWHHDIVEEFEQRFRRLVASVTGLAICVLVVMAALLLAMFRVVSQ